MITSVANPAVRRVRRLRKRTWRERKALVLVEGHRALAGALAGGAGVEEVFVTPPALERRGPLLAKARDAGAALHEVSPEVMAHLTSVATAPDVLGVAGLVESKLTSLGPEPLSAVLLSRVRDPATAGAIMALAAATGCRAAIVAPGTVDVFLPKTVRAAQGAHFHLAVVRDADRADGVGRARSLGSRVVVLADEGEPPWEADLSGPMLLVVDAQDAGWVGAGVRVAPPAGPVAPSLAARAAAVLYEWVRQRGTR